jgi:hypothetical protein
MAPQIEQVSRMTTLILTRRFSAFAFSSIQRAVQGLAAPFAHTANGWFCHWRDRENGRRLGVGAMGLRAFG